MFCSSELPKQAHLQAALDLYEGQRENKMILRVHFEFRQLKILTLSIHYSFVF
jgi:hypothetical protein